ncbi:hypothetical protein [Aquabacter spiritensis]|uniref:Uncharacterized protein n=1 Tax=Aquabacter spiritensis TaxID=933073 RepID=A0A4R3LPC1_9HYPH|nr:hypothetical protein [Aquabacter spiritensis]TCT02222.1 hypothetical protein EDC64_11483 [Aquabacter spiritensis]
MEDINRLAQVTVARACAFAFLGIACVMVGLSFDPRASFEAGGVLTLVLTFVLILKANGASRTNHRRTELWSYLPERARPAEPQAKVMVSLALREAYFTFARLSAALASGLLALSLLLGLIG